MVLPGFNTDFKYKGLVYHAQTEDNGVANPVVVTLLYLKGAILASKKSSYADLLEKASYQDDLMNLMKSQHRDIMKEVLAGKYTSPQSPEAGPAVETVEAVDAAPAIPETPPGPKSLDQAIMEFLEGFSAGAEA